VPLRWVDGAWYCEVCHDEWHDDTIGPEDVRPYVLQQVERWSASIHGRDTPRHRWCMAAAAAIFDGGTVPPFPGRPMPGVPADRENVIRRILLGEVRRWS
jgi:hypothetical protein